MSNNIKYIDIKEFREFGFLQELNRHFLHPLGMALEVIIEDDGTERLGGIWDYRDDPEGMLFGEPFNEEGLQKAKRVIEFMAKKWIKRRESFGYVVQPMPPEFLDMLFQPENKENNEHMGD